MIKNSTMLYEVAKQVGLSESYITAMGCEEQISNQTLIALLSALGYDTANDEALFASDQKRQKKEVLAPVKVFRQGEPVQIEMDVGSRARVSEFTWKVITEAGEIRQGDVETQMVSNEGTHSGTLVFLLPKMALGYHRLEVSCKDRKHPYCMAVIVAPESCYKQETLRQGKKLWGPSIQLYTLKTAHNWGIGDFGDLKQLVNHIASRGGHFIGLNPIHSLFPANPEAASPYSPSSRRWLNILYIDVCSVPEFALCNLAQELVGSQDFQQRINEARQTEWVDYSEVSALKMSVLPLLYDEFKVRHLKKNSTRAKEFSMFVEEGGESLLQQAAFDALHSEFFSHDHGVWGWPAFPKEFQHFDNKKVQQYIENNYDAVELYLYLQWLAFSQINDVQQFAKKKGMCIGLYRDLAVGVADSGSESWGDRGNLCMDVSIGAPPDILGPLGQNWGLPPLNPEVLKTTGYDAFIQLLRANMKACGALRIDHVLGLLRLWWIPKGQDATKGAYMYYPVKDMLSILALESHRQQCSIIGEDLGTVPDEIRHLLLDAGIHSYKVFFFETAEDGGYYSPEHYQQQSMSALCTHDMPTLRGFWHCDDLKMGEELGLYPDPEQLKTLFDGRAHSKQQILNSVDYHGFLPDEIGRDALHVPMDRALSEALQLHLAAGANALLSLQLEDWLEMDKPVNIPGTVAEYPNWRRKLSVTLETLFNRQEVNELTKKLTNIRAQAE